MNYFDIGIVVIIALALLTGFIKGFSKSLASLFGWIVSLTIAILLAKTVANSLLGIPVISKYFFNNPDGFSFAGWINGILPEKLQIDMSVVRNWVVMDGQVVKNAPDILLDHIKEQNSLIGIFMSIFKGSYLSSLAGPEILSYNVSTLSEAISILLANSLLILFTGIFILIVLKIVTNIIIGIARKSSYKKDDISMLSRLLGLAIGAVKGFMICVSVFVILSFAINFPFLSSARQKLFEEDSIIAGSFATTVFEWTDKLLEPNDLTKVFEAAGYEKEFELTDAESSDDTQNNINPLAFSFLN